MGSWEIANNVQDNERKTIWKLRINEWSVDIDPIVLTFQHGWAIMGKSIEVIEEEECDYAMGIGRIAILWLGLGSINTERKYHCYLSLHF